MATDFGLDLACTSDFSATMGHASGRTVPIQRFVRRLYTPRGSTPDCPNDGIDVRDFLNTPTLTEQQVAGIFQGELLKDEACLSASVVVTYSGAMPSRTMKVEIDGELADGPFELVIAVTDLTVELLSP